MREIRFRVWDSQRKRMYGCLEIHWENNGKMTFKKGSGITMDESLGDVLLQYVGRKDKNSKEMYEGDIIKFRSYVPGKPPNIGTICWQDNGSIGWSIEPKPGSSSCALYGLYSQEEYEIIGNKWENPELLK